MKLSQIMVANMESQTIDKAKLAGGRWGMFCKLKKHPRAASKKRQRKKDIKNAIENLNRVMFDRYFEW